MTLNAQGEMVFAGAAPRPEGEVVMEESEEQDPQVILLHEAMGLTQERADELQVGIFNAYRSVMDEQFRFNRADLLKALLPLASTPYEAVLLGYMACLDETPIVMHIKTERYIDMVQKRKPTKPTDTPHGYG
jgi:hypothetical protein